MVHLRHVSVINGLLAACKVHATEDWQDTRSQGGRERDAEWARARAVNVTNMLVIAMIISFVHAANWSAMWQHQHHQHCLRNCHQHQARAQSRLLPVLDTPPLGAHTTCGAGPRQIFAGQILHNIRLLTTNRNGQR